MYTRARNLFRWYSSLMNNMIPATMKIHPRMMPNLISVDARSSCCCITDDKHDDSLIIRAVAKASF